MRKGNFSEADEGDMRAVSYKTRNQFARVRPYSAESVSRYQYAHRTPGTEGWELTLGLPGFSVESRTIPREEFS